MKCVCLGQQFTARSGALPLAPPPIAAGNRSLSAALQSSSLVPGAGNLKVVTRYVRCAATMGAISRLVNGFEETAPYATKFGSFRPQMDFAWRICGVEDALQRLHRRLRSGRRQAFDPGMRLLSEKFSRIEHRNLKYSSVVGFRHANLRMSSSLQPKLTWGLFLLT